MSDDGSRESELAEELLAHAVDPEGELSDRAFELLCIEHSDLRAALVRCRSNYDAARRAVGNGHSPEDLDWRAELRAFASAARSVTVEPELGRGASSVVEVVGDSQLARRLARKTLGIDTRGRLDPQDRERVRRFMAEARLVARLEHPAILPIIAAGIDDEGRPFLETPVVHGRSLAETLAEPRSGPSAEWTTQRLVVVLVQVCEAVAYAHACGVVHRDLKPANVMIGEFGKVFVVDWGLAKRVGAEDPSPARLPARGAAPETTHDGQVLGTLPYMAPEQACGAQQASNPASDQYAIGAILYEVLAGVIPYGDALRVMPSEQWLDLVRSGAVAPLSGLAPRASPELVAVCERAMALEPGARYPDVEALVSDLRAWLEGRVVRAHAVGPLPELRKWVLRNRSTAALTVVLLSSTIVGSLLLARSAAHRAEALRDLSDSWLLPHLRLEAESLWPARPERAADMRAWLERADELVARSELHRARARDADVGADERERRARFIEELDAFAADSGVRASMRARLEEALTLERRSLVEPSALWEAARSSIADRTRCPAYDGLSLGPQLGLVPLGRDPDSGLWEFGHLPTGVLPRRDESGRLVFEEESCVVLVLLPGGRVEIGAAPNAANLERRDPLATPEEAPVHTVTLAPFFLAKHETTQAQWMRATGENPSYYAPSPGVPIVDLTHPVESVDSNRAELVARRLGLCLPTEAQWEYGARGGTDDPFGRRDARVGLSEFANLADRAAREQGGSPGWPYDDSLDDGWVLHAPVGRLRPNAFGLHDVVGNVWEWCRDGFGSYRAQARAGDGLRLDRGARGRIHRGGSFANAAVSARVSNRDHCPADSSYDRIGLRFARTVE